MVVLKVKDNMYIQSFFLFLARAKQHVGSWFPDQGSNTSWGVWSFKHWTIKKSPKEFVRFSGLCQVPVSEEGAVLKAGNLDCLEN